MKVSRQDRASWTPILTLCLLSWIINGPISSRPLSSTITSDERREESTPRRVARHQSPCVRPCLTTSCCFLYAVDFRPTKEESSSHFAESEHAASCSSTHPLSLMAPALCPAVNSTAALAAWQGGLFNASMQPCYDLTPTPTTTTAISAAVAQPSPWPVDQVVLADAQAQPKPTPTTAPPHPFARPGPPGTAAMPVATPAPEYFMAMARRAEVEEAEERWQGGEPPPPCSAPPCPPHTDVVWVASTKTVSEPKPTTTSCYTVTKTSTYYQT